MITIFSWQYRSSSLINHHKSSYHCYTHFTDQQNRGRKALQILLLPSLIHNDFQGLTVYPSEPIYYKISFYPYCWVQKLSIFFVLISIYKSGEGGRDRLFKQCLAEWKGLKRNQSLPTTFARRKSARAKRRLRSEVTVHSIASYEHMYFKAYEHMYFTIRNETLGMFPIYTHSKMMVEKWKIPQLKCFIWNSNSSTLMPYQLMQL